MCVGGGGGGRRDEEKARAKERIFSFRGPGGGWDPTLQRPELWNLYNARVHAGESVRVFPLSNWTEMDVWQYIARESIPIVPLYLAAPRPTVRVDCSKAVSHSPRSIRLPMSIIVQPASRTIDSAATPDSVNIPARVCA